MRVTGYLRGASGCPSGPCTFPQYKNNAREPVRMIPLLHPLGSLAGASLRESDLDRRTLRCHESLMAGQYDQREPKLSTP